MRFTIPTAGFEGVYIARPRVIDPSGKVHHIWYSTEVEGEKPYAPTIYLGIHPGRDYMFGIYTITKIAYTSVVAIGTRIRGQLTSGHFRQIKMVQRIDSKRK